MLTPTLSSIGEKDGQIIAEMIRNQLSDIEKTKRLQHTDFKRISKYLNQSIFLPSICTLWQGYVTDRREKNKGSYINFYFNKKKVALHRLLYINFLGNLADDEYVKFKCTNKGKCCNVYCLEKHQYKRIPQQSHKPSKNIKESSVPIILTEEKLNILFI